MEDVKRMLELHTEYAELSGMFEDVEAIKYRAYRAEVPPGQDVDAQEQARGDFNG